MRKPNYNKGKRFSAKAEEINYDNEPLIFSLERVQKKYCFSKLEKADKAFFAESLFKRKNFSISQLFREDKHGIGCEKVKKTSIKTAIPNFITDEEDYFLVFRFSGMKAMVGYRKKNIFYILWFDRDFTLYKH